VPGVTRTLIGELREAVGERVTVRGFAHAIRDQKQVQFVVMRDESGLAQAVLGKQDPPSELNRAISDLTPSPSFRSRRTRRSTSASTGATSTCDAPIAG
jgi:aspartyl/asparaginyl-tRNA synthetase